MRRRKGTPTNQKTARERLRFTPGDIVRAIEGVEAAGLKVYAVEITPTGAIKISTQASRREAAADATTSTDTPNEARTPKKAGLGAYEPRYSRLTNLPCLLCVRF
jgi:hypothetical protein